MEQWEGIRVFWDGNNLRTIDRKLVEIPNGLRDQLDPKVQFEAVLRCVVHPRMIMIRNEYDIHNIEWSNLKMMIFDAPLMYGHNYEERMNYLHSCISKCKCSYQRERIINFFIEIWEP